MPRSVERLKDYILSALALGVDLRAKWSIFWRLTRNVRVRLHLATHNPQSIYSIRTVYGPLYFRDNIGDITNLVGLFYHEVYRVRTLPHDGVILDIGANIGLAAALFAHHNPGRPIHCFEPLPTNTALIRMNCRSARIHQVAVGAGRGRVRLHVDRQGAMGSSIPCRWETVAMDFDVMSLDEFTGAEGVERVALLKIDAEGMESAILQGAPQTLNRTERVAMETHSPFLHEDSIVRLRHAGFHVDAERFIGATGMVFASRSENGADLALAAARSAARFGRAS